MRELNQRVRELSDSVKNALQAISYDDKSSRLEVLTAASVAPDFWDSSVEAQSHMQALGKLKNQLEPWSELSVGLKYARELIALDDKSLTKDLETQMTVLEAKFYKLKKQLQFNGPFDDHDVLLSIYAGAGGTDAQDWTQMLLRMYTRWAESHDVKKEIIDESAGDEAGLKSVSLKLSGQFLYGKLKGEHGVHRLVRLSPFNADAKRQTSFAKVDILPQVDKPEDVPIDDKDLKVDVFRAGGHGGQSVNTTDSAVRITHLPTNIVVSIQNERSQLQNKETAMTILRSRLAQLQMEQHLENLADIKGPNQSAEWGNQIRSYVLHPYTMVKDQRTKHETNNASGVLDGDLDPFIDSFIEQNL